MNKNLKRLFWHRLSPQSAADKRRRSSHLDSLTANKHEQNFTMLHHHRGSANTNRTKEKTTWTEAAPGLLHLLELFYLVFSERSECVTTKRSSFLEFQTPRYDSGGGRPGTGSLRDTCINNRGGTWASATASRSSWHICWLVGQGFWY